MKPPKVEMPEAWALRKIRWQFFVTLTFAKEHRSKSLKRSMLFRWLRSLDGKKSPVHFKRLLWVARWELGRHGGRGHFHIALAGIPSEHAHTGFARTAEKAWFRFAHSIAEVALWNPALDGVGYILKLPNTPGGNWAIEKAAFQAGGEDCEPTLSNSLRDTFRRRSM